MNSQPGVFNIPFRIFLLTMLLAGVGLVMVYSSSASYASYKRRVQIARHQGQAALADDHNYHDSGFLVRQGIWFCLGLIGLFCAYHVDYHRLKDTGPVLLLVSLVLLLLVFVPGVGLTINQHRRWLGIGPMTFQPSELAKLALVIYMARMLADHHDKLKRFVDGVLPALGVTALFVAVIIIEPDIGAAAVTAAILFLMWFIGGMRILHLASLAAATIPAFVLVVLCHPQKVGRVLAFARPTVEGDLGPRYQLVQSLIAVGSGGTTGLGLGNSVQKHIGYLTECYNDFIFAILCEETGLLGAVVVAGCFFLLIWEGWRVALRAPDFYATLLAAGITLMLCVSVTLNLMVVLGMAPTKGLALPLISYGGSSLLVTMTAIGVLMNIGKYVERERVESASARRGRARPGSGKRRPAKAGGWFRRLDF